MTKVVAMESRDFFVWTDDEVLLLLKVTQEYKAVNAQEDVDWEAVYTKYIDILERYREQYPAPEEAAAMGKDFPHKAQEITRVQLTTKLKAIRGKYRKAVVSGRKSGHGRVILLYFECCKAIWGGRPATGPLPSATGPLPSATGPLPHATGPLTLPHATGPLPHATGPLPLPHKTGPLRHVPGPLPRAIGPLSRGIQSTDVLDRAEEPSVCPSGPESAPGSSLGESRVAEDAVSAETVQNRALNNTTLVGCRRYKLKRMLSHADEDLELKRRMLRRQEAADAEYLRRMDSWSSMLATSNRCLSELTSTFTTLVHHIVGSGGSTQHTPRPTEYGPE